MAAELTEAQKQKAANIRAFLKGAAANGKIFSVTFVKRTTGEIRQMVCRLGVTSHLAGGEKSFSDEEKGILTVFDTQKQGYRSISCEAVTRIKVDGQEWIAPQE